MTVAGVVAAIAERAEALTVAHRALLAAVAGVSRAHCMTAGLSRLHLPQPAGGDGLVEAAASYCTPGGRGLTRWVMLRVCHVEGLRRWAKMEH